MSDVPDRKPEPEPDESPLRTVSVPPELAAPFVRAQEYVSRYFEARHEDPAHSTISISGERYILLRASSMSVEFFELVTSLYQDRGDREARGVATNILYDVAHAIGKADAKNFHKRMGVDDPIERLSAGPVHFAYSGWAFVRIDPASRPASDDSFLLLYDHPFSFEADSWLRRGEKSPQPVCVMNAGYSSGWCEESFELPLVSVEIECLAAGGAQCRFVMAPPAKIEEHLRRLEHTGAARSRGAATNVPEFFQRKRMEDELRDSRDHLERRVEERTAELVAANEQLKREITERLLAEEQLRVINSAVQRASEGIVILRATQERGRPRVTFVNDGFVKLTGISADEAIGRTMRVFRIVDGDRIVQENINRALAERKAFRSEVHATRRDGSEYALELQLNPVWDSTTGRMSHWVAILRDVTERRAQLAALERQALYDVLTGLPNRTLLRDRLEQAILVSERDDMPVALLVMDLDEFKDVNDTFGHHYGDLLLEQVAQRLKSALRAGDTVARLGGDEFAILLSSVSDAKHAVKVARKVLASLEKPFHVESRDLTVGASVGIALSPLHGSDATTLLRRADVAMYFAKQSNSGYCLYSVEHDHHTPMRLARAVDLRQAIEESQLVLYYQPKVHMRSGLVTRVEALVRWHHPEEGLLLPDEFIPVAERTGLIKKLTYSVLDQALGQSAAWQRRGLPIHVAVNLSARSLQETFLPELISELLERWNIEPNTLKLEITESSIMADPPHVLAIISLLQTMGVRFSLDDFGTGYSSLSHLRHLPVDEIKIDKSFTRDIATSRGDVAIVRAMIDLAHNLGRQVVAEGVEDAETWRILDALGCDLAQGYYLSRPLPPVELEKWLTDSRWGLHPASSANSMGAADPVKLP